MSISEYLSGLDYDQLAHAKREIERLIKQKDEESKVELWVVSDDMMNHGAFFIDDYYDAVEFMCRAIKQDAKNRPGGRLNFELRKLKFRESEVADMLGLAGEINEEFPIANDGIQFGTHVHGGVTSGTSVTGAPQ